MTHRVEAQRVGDGAFMRCSICKSSLQTADRDFEAMNRFVQEHQLCLEPSR